MNLTPEVIVRIITEAVGPLLQQQKQRIEALEARIAEMEQRQVREAPRPVRYPKIRP
jgi:hypothetical protein